MKCCVTSARYDSFDVIRENQWLLEIPPEERKASIKEECAFISWVTGEKVISIGDLSGGYIELYITESGKLVIDTNIVGNTAEEAINNIVKNKLGRSVFSLNGYKIDNNTLFNYKFDTTEKNL